MGRGVVECQRTYRRRYIQSSWAECSGRFGIQHCWDRASFYVIFDPIPRGWVRFGVVLLKHTSPNLHFQGEFCLGLPKLGPQEQALHNTRHPPSLGCQREARLGTVITLAFMAVPDV